MNVLACCTACSRDSFTKSDWIDATSSALRTLSKLFEVLSRVVKRLPGHSRDRMSESFDGFGCRGYSIECAIAASGGWFCLRAPFSHFFLLMIEIIHQIFVVITHVCGLRNKKFVVYPTKNWTKLVGKIGSPLW